MKWYAQIVGYGFPVFLGVILMRNVVDRLWDCVAPDGSKNPKLRPEPWQPRALAFIEAILYVAFLQLGQGWFIGIWFGLKVVGQWKRWMVDGDVNSHKPDGPVIFNVYLIGNALLILHSYVGFKLIGWIDAGRLRTFWAPALIVALTLLFWQWLARFRKSPSPTSESQPATAGS